MPRRKLLVPAVPTVTPEQGTLAETLMLGDAASIHASPAAKLRWFKDRSEIQQIIIANEVGKAKNETAIAVQAKTDAEVQLKTAADEIAALKSKLQDIEDQHASELKTEQGKAFAATEQAAILQKQMESLKPAIDELNAQKKEEASKKFTAVRLKVEENQLVDVFGEIGFHIDGLKGA